jgi:hypothetical protein
MLPINRRTVGVLVVAGLVALPLSACSKTAKEAAIANDERPSTNEPIKGTSRSLVTLSAKAAERIGVRTAPIRLKSIAGAQRKVMPYDAVLYDQHGNTYAYTSPKPRVFVRRGVKVDYIKGSDAVLSHGPPSRTAVVTVGSQELFGVEYEVAED